MQEVNHVAWAITACAGNKLGNYVYSNNRKESFV